MIDAAQLPPLFHDFSRYGVIQPADHILASRREAQRAQEPWVWSFILQAISRCETPPSVLEVGPDGYYALFAMQNGAATAVVLCDNADHMAAGREVCKALGHASMSFVATGNPLPRTKFDIVILNGVLHWRGQPLGELGAYATMAERFLIVASTVSLARREPEYFEAPAPGSIYGSRFSEKWLENAVSPLGSVLGHGSATLDPSVRLEDRGGSYWLLDLSPQPSPAQGGAWLSRAKQTTTPQIQKIAFLVQTPEIINHYRPVWRALGTENVHVILHGSASDRTSSDAAATAEGVLCVSSDKLLAEGTRYDCLVSNHPVTLEGHTPLIKRLGAVNVRFMYALGKAGWNLSSWNDLYDVILCFGPYQVEALAGVRAAKVAMGYPRFDAFFHPAVGREQLLRDYGGAPGRQTVVWLPTWQNLSSVGHYDAAIAALTERYNVLVKVHPLMVDAEPDKIAALRRHRYTALITDARDNLPLYRLADFLLCDYGGPAFGGLYTDRNILLLDVPGAANHSDTGPESPDVMLRQDLRHVSLSEADEIGKLLDDKTLWMEQRAARRRLRHRYFAPFYGFSSAVAAEALLNVPAIVASS